MAETLSLERPEFRVNKFGSNVIVEIYEKDKIVDIEMSKWDFKTKERKVDEVTWGNLVYALTAINDFRGKTTLDLVKEFCSEYLSSYEEEDLMQWLHERNFSFKKI